MGGVGAAVRAWAAPRDEVRPFASHRARAYNGGALCPPGAPRDASQRIGNARDLDGGNHTDYRFVPPSAR